MVKPEILLLVLDNIGLQERGIEDAQEQHKSQGSLKTTIPQVIHN
jgi:hypothetical protein